MKKLLLLLTVIAGTSFSGSAQVTKGSIVIDPYIGFPNSKNMNTYNDVELSFIDALIPFSSSDLVDGSFKTLGGLITYGGRVEYMLTEKFGIGADFNYMKAGFEAQVADSLYSTQTMQYDSVATYRVGKTKTTTRAMIRLNYHFVQNEKVDAYTGFAAGLKIVDRVTTNESPYGLQESLLGDDALFPVSVRIALGTRIYFTDNIGMNIELGLLGGSIIQTGLSIKF